MPKQAVKTVSLVLGSGGARGLAHIGVIEWLEANGYEIRAISGCSMGALVGGIHAAGKLESYKRWVLALKKSDVIRFLDFSFSTSALFRGERIIDALRDLVGEHRIEDLPIAFTAVATDIERQREVWLADGPLFEAIRSSIAVPTIFTPHEYQDMTLLDGGLINPVPIAPTFKERTDLTIAVDLNGPASESDEDEQVMVKAESHGWLLPGQDTYNRYRERISDFLDNLQQTLEGREEEGWDVFELLNSAFETMQSTIAEVKLATYPPDVLIEIPRDASKFYEFYRARELIELGYRKTAEKLQQ